MKKISIYTIQDKSNLGNRLQNYAMQKILSAYGDVYSLTYRLRLLYNKKSILFEKFYILLSCCRSFIKKLTDKRFANFLKFNKHIKYGKNISLNSAIEIAKYYDYFVVGSDQIWNPDLTFKSEFNLLGFCEPSKRIAVAPSIANDSINEKVQAEFKSILSEYSYLSCREKPGADFIMKLTGKECTNLIDPTLMLSVQDWDKVSNRPKWHKNKKNYMLLYFLGGKTDKHIKFFESIRNKFNLDIIDLYDKKSRYYNCGPSEFLWLVKNSTLVLTDSFHGSIFSYIYGRPFKILRREGKEGYMNARLSDLIEKLELPDNIYIDLNYDIQDILEIQYSYDALLKQQNIFRNYLNKVFTEKSNGV